MPENKCKNCTCRTKTDLEKFKELYKQMEIELKIETIRLKTTSVQIMGVGFGTTNTRIGGDKSTYSIVYFNQDGKFVFQGFYDVTRSMKGR